jgi:hypothetical protein
MTDLDEVGRLLAFSRPGRFEAYPVSSAVSSNRSNGPHLLDPVGLDELEGVVDPMTGEILGTGEDGAAPGTGGPNPA